MLTVLSDGIDTLVTAVGQNVKVNLTEFPDGTVSVWVSAGKNPLTGKIAQLVIDPGTRSATASVWRKRARV